MTPKENLTPEFREKSEELDQARSESTRARWLTIALVVFAALTITAFTAVGLLTSADRAATATNAGDIVAIRQDLKSVCRQADPASLPTSEQDKCYRAEANLPPQSPPTVVTIPGKDGVTPSDVYLLALIRSVIAENPPKDGHTPTAEELLALIKPLIPAPVPGADGVTPSDDRLLALIRPLIPAPVPGTDGVDGTNGTNGTDGKQGPQGWGVTDQRFVLDDSGACVDRTTYTNPADGTTRVQDTPAGAASCPHP
jgi:hypothetical protein